MIAGLLVACAAFPAPQSAPAASSPAGGGAEVVSLAGPWRFARDADGQGAKIGFAAAGFDDARWSPIEAGRSWEAQGLIGVDGQAWYRRAFTLARAPEGAALLELGRIDDADEVYVNGRLVGSSGAFPPRARSAATASRAYRVPIDALRAGANVVAVRVHDEGGDGGIVGGVLRLTVGAAAARLADLRTRRAAGFPAANFALAAELGVDGEFPARLVRNPPAEGARLEEIAAGSLSFAEGPAEVRAVDALDGPAERAWPFARARYASPRLPELEIELEAFCPITSVGEPYWGGLPLALASFRLRNRADRERTIDLVFDLAFEGDARAVVLDPRPGGALTGFDADALSARTDGGAGAFVPGLSTRWTCRARVPARGAAEVRVCFARSTAGTESKGEWSGSDELAAAGVRDFAHARAATALFEEWLPRTGDAAIDSALRVYVAGAVMATKVAPGGRVAITTDGAMSQQDAFWAGAAHAVLFPELERRMVDEAFLAQRPDGKVPTAIFPTLDRGEESDSSCYALLRAFRYARWHYDSELLEQVARNLLAAAAWLRNSDRDGDGLPDGAGGGDALDLAKRKVSPRAALLYVASLERLAEAMRDGGSVPGAREDLRDALAKARKAVEGAAAEGGLWSGAAYVERWADGSTPAIVNHDQVVGVLLGGAPRERAAPIFESLKPGRRAWGQREWFPYRPESLAGRAGGVGNGAVRPWLNFADAWARFDAGRGAEATALLRDVAHQDLVAFGDAMPHAALDGEDGANLGAPGHAPSGAFFGAVFHGMFGVERLSAGEVQVAPRALPGAGWRVRLPLREGDVDVMDGPTGPRVRWRLAEELALRVALPGRAPFEARLPVGDGTRSIP